MALHPPPPPPCSPSGLAPSHPVSHDRHDPGTMRDTTRLGFTLSHPKISISECAPFSKRNSDFQKDFNYFHLK
jgi:hypothetical protein